MKSEQNISDYWFTIEPYVYVGLTNKNALLYNTLDGVSLESDEVEVVELLREMLQEKHCGVFLLRRERYARKEVNDFIRNLREKFMGDVIDVTLSKGKPVQVLPFYNFSDKHDVYKKLNKFPYQSVLANMSEISIHVNNTTNVAKLIPFLQSISGHPTFNIVGNVGNVENYSELLSFFNQHPSPKYILCSYTDVIPLQPVFENDFSYRVSIHFPLNMQQWDRSRDILLQQSLPCEYVFDVTSEEDYLQTDRLIDSFGIEKYRINPVYTGDNISFFEENIFLTKEDILSTSMSIKDFLIRHSINLYDFGKINILPNGDAYANINHPALGNIYTHSILEIVHREMEEGKSWFRIRNYEPCNDCVYQLLCPSPSNYEIAIGRHNLCHVKQ